MATTNTQTPPRRAPRPMRFIFTRIVLVLVAMLIAVGGGAYLLSRGTPGYWKKAQRAIDNTPTDQLSARGEALQQRVFNTFSRLGPTGSGDGLSQLRIGVDEANAWLRTQLPYWQESRGRSMPAGVSQPMVAIQDGRVVLAFRFERESFDQVVSLFFDVKLVEAGRVRVKLAGVRGGRLPIPIQTLAKMADPSDAKGGFLTAAIEGTTFDAVVRDSQHEVAVVGIDVEKDAVVFTLRQGEH
ncbi:MAG: hypothetical protein GC164_06520 [Phycisphaera sp.]|nr:hypothetical protein [Phycisphaera sp.]